MDIKNKIALVTGSTRGIGRAIAEQLCKEGALVYLNSRNAEEGEKLEAELRQQEGEVTYINGDVSSEDDVRRIFKSIRQRGTLNIVVNNAGIYRDDRRDYRNYETIHKVNGYGYFLCSCLAAEIMNEGKIINISSIYGSNPDQDAILASGVKAEVEAYTKSLSH